MEQTLEDGRKLREFFTLNCQATLDKINAAVRNPETKEVRVLKVGRNEPCPCGSGKKYKKCCGR